MGRTSVQHYGSTLAFSIVRSDFLNMNSTLPTQTIVRTFNKFSANLSQCGSWRCVFEESKKQHQQSVELQLSLNWVPCSGSLTGSGYQGREGQDTARELISRIRSVKIRSDSTLSELLVARLDGRCLLVGEFIRVRLQPDRVLKNGRYRFRIGFFTKMIPNSSPLERPLFTNFLDIDAEFSPVRCRPNELPDVTFQFPTSDSHGAPRIIMAHSSEIKKSQYFAHRVTEVVEEKKRRGIPFSGITCEITEFTPAVFRVMLQFLYTGELRVKSISGEREEKASAGHSSQAKKGPPKKRAFLNKNSRLGGCIRLPEKVYFEDLYRIAERYEIPPLSALSLKGMQCDLNMSIAIAMLVKLPRESVDILGTSCSQAQDYEFKGEIHLDKIQVQLVKSIIKEYIQFYAVEATMLRRPDGKALSVQESLTVIHHIGGCVLDSVEHTWD
ncbi:hypothetical protein BGX21_010648 [Mortierella sp. AD011]|nr:hypothetical protein BGX20_011577 [Mortierella sp. AD010]KAF9393743.1 hypothetical protein BGX21_010648 [Mortierella sp. AD011]